MPVLGSMTVVAVCILVMNRPNSTQSAFIHFCGIPCFQRVLGVVGWCLVSFQCRGVQQIWIRVGQGPTALAIGSGGGCLDIFTLVCHFSFLSPSLWETARYRLKYCLKGPLSRKQPTNQSRESYCYLIHLEC